MAAQTLPIAGNSNLTPAPKAGVDRKALRETISQRYEHTLRRLGR